jgi:hypothetical protein
MDEQVRSAAIVALTGDVTAQRWLESMACLEDSSQILAFWEAALAVLSDVANTEEPVRCLVVSVLRKAVVSRWALMPLDLRSTLYPATYRVLESTTSVLTPVQQSLSTATRMLSQLMVLEALCVDDDDGQWCRLLAMEVLQSGLAATELPPIMLSLQLLRDLAEETISGKRLSKQAALGGKEAITFKGYC